MTKQNKKPKEHRKVQVLSVNQDIRRQIGLFSYDEEPKINGKHLLHNFVFIKNKTCLNDIFSSCTCSNIG